jgi:signal transduction histidine kinase
MDLLGQLTCGIAHDINNLVSAIDSYARLILHQLGPGDVVRPLAEEICRAGESVASLTRHLTAVARKGQRPQPSADLAAVVTGMQRLLRHWRAENVTLVTDLSARRPVRGDPILLEQVLLNLALNAHDAMPGGGGELVIRTADVEVPEGGLPGGPALAPGPYVRVSVTDTGCGMDEAPRGRLFEPFFTTKAPGAGTGLGLAMVDHLVRQSGGAIEVVSAPGRGSTFTVYLPTADAPGGPSGVPPPLSFRRGVCDRRPGPGVACRRDDP